MIRLGFYKGKSMKVVLLVVILVCIGFFVIEKQKQHEDDIQSKHFEWTLLPLTGEQRQNKIQKLIRGRTFDFYESAYSDKPQNIDSRNKCLSIFDALQRNESVSILNPVHVTQSIVDDGWVQGLLKKCGDRLDVDKSFASSFGWNDGKKPYLYYFQASANMEFYDLSPYLDLGYWGFFGEGARPKGCSGGSSFCTDWIGYQSIGQVFNLDSCKTEITLHPRRRLKTHVNAIDNDVGYYKSNAFSAFVVLREGLFYLGLDTNEFEKNACFVQPCPDLSEVNQNFRTILNLEKINSQSDSSPLISCNFISYHNNKKETDNAR